MKVADEFSGTIRLRVRPKFKAHAIAGQALILLSDRHQEVLEGAIFADVLPWLGRSASEVEIVDALEHAYPREWVHYAIRLMRSKELLIVDQKESIGANDIFWDELNVPYREMDRLLSRITVGVAKVGDVDPRPVVDALTRFGISARIVGMTPVETFQVVVTDDYLHPNLDEVSCRNRDSKRPWLLCSPAGTRVYVGPLFEPDGACWQCLSWRLRTNRALEGFVGRQENGGRRATQASGSLLPMGGIVAELVTLEIAKWASGKSQQAPAIIDFDAATLATSRHILRRRPQCGLCGDPTLQAERMTRSLSLNDAEESRIEKFSQVSFLVDEMTGVVRSVTPTPTLPNGLCAYHAEFGFGRDALDFSALKRSFLSQAAGVGQTEESAKVGAVCEAIERYSGMWHGDEGSLVASYDSIDPTVRIHPNDCMLYSELQYTRRREINAIRAAFDFVPEPFVETLPIQWTGVWSLTLKRFKLLPSSYLFYNSPQPIGGPFCWADSNGCAAGASQTDAIRRGLYELIERDSVAIWWYNRVRRPEIDLRSFRSEYFDIFVESYEQVDRRVWVLDVTGDLAVPTCVAVSASRLNGPENILMSFGSNLDIRQAIERALFEMNHLLPAVLQCNLDANGDYPYPDESSKQWWRTATLANQPYLVPLDDAPKLTAADYANHLGDNASAQARHLVRDLESRGYEVLVMDQTRPDIGIHVVRTIVPGLRHFWSRFAPGRLFDVPVSMGWLPKPQTEQDLNPISMFL